MAEPDQLTAANAELVAAILNRLAPDSRDPVELALNLHQDAEFAALDQRLKFEVDCFLNLELEPDQRRFGSVSLAGGAHPLTSVRSLGETPAEAVQFWRELDARFDEPMLKAHMSDVLLSSRAESSQDHATATAKAYVALAGRPQTDPYYVSIALARAATIARVRSLAIEATIRGQIKTTVALMLDASESVGVVMRALDALAASPRTYEATVQERADVSELLDRAAEAFSSPVGADSVAAARREHASTSAERDLASRRHAEAYLESAREEENGFRRMYWAKEAAELAERYGLRDIHDDAVRLMQSIDEEDMGWRTVEVEVPPVPKAAFRAHLRRYRRARDWRSALTVFLGGDSPSGRNEQNLGIARRASAGSIRALVSRTTFGAHGMPERSDQDFEEEELIRLESFSLGTSGILLTLELNEITRRFGSPDEDEVRDWMRANFDADPQLAAQFAVALRLFNEDRAAESARVSIPLIEAGARALLLRLDTAVYRLERGSSPGRFPSMDFYIDKLEERGLDIDWVRAIRTMLLSPGNNARNLTAHGFKWDFAEWEAAVVLRLAGLFCVMPVAVEVEEAAAYLREPLARGRGKLKRRLGWVWSA